MEKRIVAINCNVASGGGKVMLGIAETARKKGYKYYTYSPQSKKSNPENHNFFVSRKENYLNMKVSKITGYDNATLKTGTKRLIRDLEAIKPDLIHLHGLHGWYVDYREIFTYIKKNKIPVLWTQHDCWAFTGKCPHFSAVNCNKWKTECGNCPQLKRYPESNLIDNSKYMFKFKKEIFTGVENLTIIGVSKWMEDILHQSFLSEYPIKIIENGINTSIFKSTPSNLKEKYGLENKFLILGVASSWGGNKGLEEFFKLRKLLPDSLFSLVVIGVNEDQLKLCDSNNILGIGKTDDINQLIEWYSTCDIFFNPSIEETFGLVTTEAMACGATVIVYNSTASPEIVNNTDNFCVEPFQLDQVVSIIEDIKNNVKVVCKTKSVQKVKEMYEQDTQYHKYIEFYEQNILTTKETHQQLQRSAKDV